MRVLVIEDDEFKAKQIVPFLNAELEHAEISVARSVTGGVRALTGNQFDVIVLDMSLPTYDVGPGEPGGRSQGFGGKEILGHLGRLGVVLPVVVLTQYRTFDSGREQYDLNKLRKMLQSEYPQTFRDIVHYNSATEQWKVDLRTSLAHAIGGSANAA